MTKEEVQNKIEQAEKAIIELNQIFASLKLYFDSSEKPKQVFIPKSIELLNYYSEKEIVHSITKMICRIYNLEESYLLKSKSPKPCKIRYIMFYTINKLTSLTHSEIATILEIDRTTVRRGVLEIDGYVKVGSRTIKKDYEIIEGAIQAFLKTNQELIPFLKVSCTH
jgi:hypothetical protein